MKYFIPSTSNRTWNQSHSQSPDRYVVYKFHFIFTSKLQRLSKLQPVLDSGETILEDRQTALTHFY